MSSLFTLQQKLLTCYVSASEKIPDKCPALDPQEFAARAGDDDDGYDDDVETDYESGDSVRTWRKNLALQKKLDGEEPSSSDEYFDSG